VSHKTYESCLANTYFKIYSLAPVSTRLRGFGRLDAHGLPGPLVGLVDWRSTGAGLGESRDIGSWLNLSLRRAAAQLADSSIAEDRGSNPTSARNRDARLATRPARQDGLVTR
jgi:hypothetical protein